MICKFKYELGQSNNFKYVAAIFEISRFSNLHYNFLLVKVKIRKLLFIIIAYEQFEDWDMFLELSSESFQNGNREVDLYCFSRFGLNNLLSKLNIRIKF